MTTVPPLDDGRDQLSRGVSPGTGYMIWQCGKCARWHYAQAGANPPHCLRCDADCREWMATVGRTEYGDLILGDVLVRKLIRQANKFEKEAINVHA